MPHFPPEQLPQTPPPPPQPWLRPALRRLREPANIFAIFYLLALLGVSYHYLLVSVSQSWFASSDEYVVVAEVIRFSQLDFHQHFFDMPGTPFMLLVSAMWSAFYWISVLVTPGHVAGGIAGFTFKHLDWMFGLARATTLCFHGLSLILIFCVAQKVLNKAGAFIASLLLMMSAVYASYSSFVRVESMAICFLLGAVLVAYFALDHRAGTLERRPTWRDPLFLSGILAGMGAGVRLHSLFASAPLLWLILVLHPRPSRSSYPRWVLVLLAWAVPLMAFGGAALFYTVRTQLPPDRLHARALLEKALIGAVSLTLIFVCLYWLRKARPVLIALVPTEAIKAGLGFCVGVLGAVPTLIPQFRYFLESTEAYSSSYVDWYRTSWPLWKNVRWLVSYYMNVVASDRIALYLLLAGACLILLARDRKAFPYLAAAILFFTSKPLNLVAAAHHVIVWLPAYAIVSAYPIAKAYLLLRTRLTKGSLWANAVFGIAFMVIAFGLTNGPALTSGHLRSSAPRFANIARAAEWMNGHALKDSYIEVAFYCFNPDIFYAWIRSLDVPGTPAEASGAQHAVWWGRRRELEGRAGYACLTQSDVPAVKSGISPAEANQAVDPYTDPAFERAVSFGEKDDQVDVFRFDLRTPLAIKK